MVDNSMHYMARLKGHYWVHPDEVKSLGYVILVSAFILSFDRWGAQTFDAIAGLSNFLGALIVCAIGVLVHDAAHRAAAIKLGYEIEHRVWFAGMAISLALVIVSRGFFKIFLVEAMRHTPVRLHRMGRYPYLGTAWDYSMLYLAGPVTSLILAGLFAAAGAAAGISGGIIGMAIQFNLIYGLASLLPIPPLDGMWILIYSRGVYTGLFVGAVSYMIMTMAGLTGFSPLIIAILIGIISGIYWMKKYD